MKIKRSAVTEIIKEVLQEMSATGGGAAMSPGTGAQYASNKAFKKGGLKVTKRPKHPSSTKLIDYLESK